MTPGDRALLGLRVLVVDDSDINLDVTDASCSWKAPRCCLASNGQEAFDLLRDAPRSIDVVLMDVQMPVLDGHDATRRIRLELGLVDLPIIALTAGALSSERQSATAAGMDDYIVKPFDARSLVASILRHVSPGEVPHAPSSHSDPEPQRDGMNEWPAIEGIDLTDARSRLGDDFDLFRSMLRRLLNENADLALPSSGVDSDAATLASYAARMHKLRGSAGMLGAKLIHRLAGEIESACLAGSAKSAERLSLQLATLLKELKQGAGPALRMAQAVIKPAQPEGEGDGDLLDPADLAELVDMLRRQNISAIDRFKGLGPILQRAYGKQAFESVREQVEELRFADAADALNTRRV